MERLIGRLGTALSLLVLPLTAAGIAAHEAAHAAVALASGSLTGVWLIYDDGKGGLGGRIPAGAAVSHEPAGTAWGYVIALSPAALLPVGWALVEYGGGPVAVAAGLVLFLGGIATAGDLMDAAGLAETRDLLDGEPRHVLVLNFAGRPLCGSQTSLRRWQ